MPLAAVFPQVSQTETAATQGDIAEHCEDVARILEALARETKKRMFTRMKINWVP
jgi:hypothetical protein